MEIKTDFIVDDEDIMFSSKINRFEVIDNKGRAYVKYNVKDLSFQINYKKHYIYIKFIVCFYEFVIHISIVQEDSLDLQLLVVIQPGIDASRWSMRDLLLHHRI